MTKSRLGIALLLHVFLAASVSLHPVSAAPAQTGQQVEKKTPGTVHKAEEKPSGAPQEKPDYSHEPFVFEQFHTRVRFEKDGTGWKETAIRVRVQSEAGVQQLGQLVFGYNSGNERVEIAYIRVHKADGSVVTAGADAVQDLTAPVARDAPVYTDFRQKHVTVPGLRPGEVLEYKVINHLDEALAPGQFWLEYDFIDRVIVLDERLEVNIPSESTIKLKTAAGADPDVREEDGRRVYTWKHAFLKRADDEEEEAPTKKRARRKPEPPAVQLTTFQTWEELGRWYADLERNRVTPDEQIRAKAAELLRDHTGEEEKVRTIYDFVARNFRYVSLSFGVGRYQPHAAAEVLANQYGDCKDKHTLLAALARAAGLKAFPVLINSTREIDPEVPSPSQFNHVISAVPLGRETLWMDTTTEVAPFGLLAATLRDKQALVVPDDAPPYLATTPADLPFPATQHVKMEGAVSELGKLTATVHYTLRGDSELLLRMAFRRTPKNQWKQLAQIVAYSDGLRGEVSEVNASDPAATREPFRLEYKISRANFLDWSSKKSQLNLPLPAMGLPEAEADDEESDEPLKLGTPLEVHTRLQLTFPDKYSTRAPVPVVVTRDYAEYRSSYQLEGSTLRVERDLVFRKHELPATRTRDYLAFQRAVRADEGQTLSLETTAAGTPTIPESAKTDELVQAAGSAFRGENYPLAADLLKRAVKLEPDHKKAWSMLGTVYFVLQDYEQAVASFQKQSEINPYDENAFNLMGVTRWRQQKYEESAAAFHKQLEVNPLHKDAQANLAQMMVEWRKYTEAIPELEKAIALQPDAQALHVALGRAYLNVGQGEKALAAFDKAVELAPEPTVWNNVAYYLSLSGTNLDRAQQYAESAVAAVSADLRNISLDRLTTRDLQKVSSLAAYWDTLGWVHFQKGDLPKAERYVKAAWLLDLHGEVGDHLGQIHEKQGRKEDAIVRYASALAASRPEPETRERLNALLPKYTEKELDALVQTRGRGELMNSRLIASVAPWTDETPAEADFFVLLSVSSATPRKAHVEAVKFIQGNEKLRGMAEDLTTAEFGFEAPDATPTRLVRRGTLQCPAKAELKTCSFLLQPAERVTSVN